MVGIHKLNLSYTTQAFFRQKPVRNSPKNRLNKYGHLIHRFVKPISAFKGKRHLTGKTEVSRAFRGEILLS